MMKQVETETKSRTIPGPAYMSRVVSGQCVTGRVLHGVSLGIL